MAPVKKVSVTKFNPCWLADSQYVDWLAIDEKNDFSAKCKVCMYSFELGNTGKKAIIGHNSSIKHKNNVSAYKKKSSKLLAAEAADSSSADPASTPSEPDSS